MTLAKLVQTAIARETNLAEHGTSVAAAEGESSHSLKHFVAASDRKNHDDQMQR
jgi:hypothetical protein